MQKIKFYPFSSDTAKFAPLPQPASKVIPEWYKRQPASMNDEDGIANQGVSNGTIKRCMPIFDMMTAGYVLSLPMDIHIDASDPEQLKWSTPITVKKFANDMIATHHPDQVANYPLDKEKYHKQLFRIMPFWSVKTPPGFSTMFMHPNHSDHLPFRTVPGFVDTDKFISDGHFSMHIEKGFTGIIKQGTPFAQLIPVKREEWEMEIVDQDLADTEIREQRLKIRSIFRHGYKEKFREKKEYK